MPDTTYNLAPNPVWQFTDFSALFLRNGKMYTYRDLARTEPKPVYKDNEGTIPWENPLILSDPDGSAYPIYWASDENYYIEIYDEDDNLKYVFTDFNAPGFGDSPAPNAPPINKNYIIDGQFTFPTETTFNNIQSGTWIAPKWAFIKNSPSTSTDNLLISAFPAGQNEVPLSPPNYLNLTCTIPGLDSSKFLCNFMNDVTLFQGQTIVLGFWAKSSFSNLISVNLRQYFGITGSPLVDTPWSSFQLTNSWAFYSAPLVVPSIAGKTISGGNDAFEIFFNVPTQSAFNFQITNVQLQIGSVATQYDFEGYDIERYRAFGQKLPVPTLGNPTPDIGKYLTLGYESTGGTPNEPAFVLTQLPLYPGFTIMGLVNPDVPYPGWTIGNGSPVSAYENNMEAYNLYVLQWQLNGGFNSDIFFAAGDGFTCDLVDGGMNVLVTNVTQGDAVDASDFNTGMTIDTTVDGGIGISQVTKIFALPQGALSAGTYFTINGVTHQFCCYITIDGIGINPNLIDHISIPIPLTTGMTASQVAAVIAFQLQGAFFGIDITGFFPRFGPSTGNGRDPDYLSRIPGNVVASTQNSAVQEHTHDYDIATVVTGGNVPARGGTPTAPVGNTFGVTGAPISSGETRGINIYLLPLIKL